MTVGYVQEAGAHDRLLRHMEDREEQQEEEGAGRRAGSQTETKEEVTMRERLRRIGAHYSSEQGIDMERLVPMAIAPLMCVCVCVDGLYQGLETVR